MTELFTYRVTATIQCSTNFFNYFLIINNNNFFNDKKPGISPKINKIVNYILVL